MTPTPDAATLLDRMPDVYDRMCPSRGVLEHVTSRWGVLVLIALSERGYRFSELRRRVSGVSEKMLAQTLQTLERDGMVLRVVHPVIPPRVDYSLTPMGAEAAAMVSALAHWVEGRMCAVTEARDSYDAAAEPAAGAAPRRVRPPSRCRCP
ncbi:helix-turn-helix domain-containing protein [Kitasatospora sp. NPDC002227]|uniref:winged helix-turn-helix transcriptional regulator n=1 Tax=Kitasatospora sp. NPDC002227 TaxID=3154773 RepID=UPI003330BBB6